MSLKAIVLAIITAMALFACSEPYEEAVSNVLPQDAAERDAGADSGSADPCKGIDATGQCTSLTSFEACATPSGGKRTRITQNCAPFETCSQAPRAHCALAPGRCLPGSEQCPDTSHMQSCDANGNWEAATPCLGCSTASGLGVTCPGTLPASSATTISGTVSYEAHSTNADRTDWDTHVQLVPSREAVIMSFAVGPQDPNNAVPIDAVLTDPTGAFTLAAAANPGPGDHIVIFTMQTTTSGPLFALIRPDFPDGTVGATADVPDTENSLVWNMMWPTSVVAANPQLTISDADGGAGIFQMYDVLRWAHEQAEAMGGPSPRSLAVLMRPNTGFDCGACFYDQPLNVAGYGFDAQVRFGAPAGDDRYWADSVVAHEFGHSVMAAYGVSPNEGGTHIVECKSSPGMAWSEGWATGFSSLVRDSSIYADKQNGTFFWFDVSQAGISTDAQWQAPDPSGGLLQLMNENAVASVLWNLANPANDDGTGTPFSATFMKALAAPRMTASPFARDYTQHLAAGSCDTLQLTDTGVSAPMLADYLDSLLCNNLATPSQVQTALGGYPYDVTHPSCR